MTATRGDLDLADLPSAHDTETVDLAPGSDLELRIAPVAKTLGGAPVRMLAYNGSVPGPTLRAAQGTQATVHIENHADMPATVHWHGLRLDNRYDGTHLTQHPIPVGGRFTALLEFPDPGLYWYHPHIRSDYGLEMGLAGTILVQPADPGYWPPAHRELVVTLDDVLLADDGQIAPFDPHQPTHVAMGRFGDVLLANGDPALSLSARPGEVVRFYLVNTANTRVFNIAVPGARVKLVGGDSGRVEREEFVDEVVLAPSERVVLDVLFDRPGELRLEHRTPDRVHPLATVAVGGEPVESRLAKEFDSLRTNPDMVDERARVQAFLEAAPDKTLSFLAEMNLPEPQGVATFACPMHPDVVSDAAGHCPKCGMKLLPVEAPSGYVCPMHPDVTSDRADSCPQCGMRLVSAALVSGAGAHHGHAEHHDMPDHDMPDHAMAGHDAHDEARADQPSAGIEWEDDMVAVNRITTPENMRWKLVDRDTGAENTDIDWTFKVGDQVKLRLLNEMAGDHPMHHPFHIHGAGRFLVLSRDGTPDPNLVWKDTVLVRTGEQVDILLDVTHPGAWMAHCHIAEHHEANMMLAFTVTE
jgi:FtsP/CotA-like multicopper oxidase with cupredoxin domain